MGKTERMLDGTLTVSQVCCAFYRKPLPVTIVSAAVAGLTPAPSDALLHHPGRDRPTADEHQDCRADCSAAHAATWRSGLNYSAYRDADFRFLDRVRWFDSGRGHFAPDETSRRCGRLPYAVVKCQDD